MTQLCLSLIHILDANGKIEADARKTAEAEEYIQKCKQILLTGLIGRGYSVKEVTQEVPMCDWILQTDAVEMCIRDSPGHRISAGPAS